MKPKQDTYLHAPTRFLEGWTKVPPRYFFQGNG